jgi:hypothetical protein
VLGVGRAITVKMNYQNTYFGQDETPVPQPKKKAGVAMYIDPY